MNELTLVTAFFDIGRGEIENRDLRRSNDKYFSYFEVWARMQNRMIIYTTKKGEYKEKALEIRRRYKLEELTEVISIENPFEIESEMFSRMQEVSKSTRFRMFRYYPDAFSNEANYDYIMLMKYWCLFDAYNRNLIPNMAAWIDFGYGHGKETFRNPKDFSFCWKYKTEDIDKIHLFALKEPVDVSGIQSLQMLSDTIMGATICVPANLIKALWDLVKEAMEALLMLDCIDDDQQLLLMAYKARPDLFEIHIMDWFYPVKQWGTGGGVNIEFNQKEDKRGDLYFFIKQFYRKIKGNYRVLKAKHRFIRNTKRRLNE